MSSDGGGDWNEDNGSTSSDGSVAAAAGGTAGAAGVPGVCGASVEALLTWIGAIVRADGCCLVHRNLSLACILRLVMVP